MRLRAGLLAFVAALVSGTAWGQAVVNGAVVYGNSSKPVPNIEVHLVNKTAKPPVDRIAKTGDDGQYEFDDVAPGGGYAVAVYDSTGKLVGTDTLFSVSAADPLHTAVPDIDISRGLTAERANKAGGFIQLDQGISPGSNISNEQVRDLPLYNRNFLNLGEIQPGVHDVQQGSPLQGAAFSIAGSPSTSTYFLLDGVDNVASSTNQAIPFQINEAVREFRVTYANPDLRYGQGSGGIVDVITSSGDTGRAGSGWHGSLFGYFNNDALNSGTPLSVYSNSGFAKAAAYSTILNPQFTVVALSPSMPLPAPITNCTNPPLPSYVVFCGYAPQSYNELYNLMTPGSPIGIPSCNTAFCQAGAFNAAGVLSTQDSHDQPVNSKQFGGSIGGKIGKNAFLFGSYEGTLINNPTPIFERVPTYFDRQAFSASNATDAAIAQSLMALYPTPNVGQTGSSLITNSGTGVLGFYRGVAPNYTHVHTVQVRPDIPLGKIGTVSLRYTGQLLDQLHDDTLPAGGAYPGNGADRKAQNQSAAISYNSQFRQNRNILNIAFTQYRVDEVAQDRGFNVGGTGLNLAAMPTFAISGLDDQTTATAPGSLGKVGGWYDSFWQTNCPSGGGGISACEGSTLSQTSPSPITPSLDGDFPLARLGPPLAAPSKHRDTEAFLSDVLELHVSNRSILTLGGDYRYQQNYSVNGGQTRGLIVSNNLGEFTHDSESCISCTPVSAFAHPTFDYELRQPSDYVGDLRSSSFGVFAQEQAKLRPNLTLQGGVRYEYFGQQLDTLNRLWNYNFSAGGLNRQGATGTFDAFDYQCTSANTYGQTFFDSLYGSFRTSVPSGTVNCSSANFQLPQIKNNVTGMGGAAYSWGKDARHVVRAAVGGYFDHAPSSYNEKLLQNRPSPYNVNNPRAIYGQNFASSYASPNCQQGTQCGFGLSTLNLAGTSAAGSGTAQSGVFQNYQAASEGEVLYARDANALKTPYLVQFSASYQYRFSGSWAGEIGYVGSKGAQLPLVYDGNFANEFYCQTNKVCGNNTYFPVFTQSNIGSSNYDSLIARVEGRLYKGLSMHASYTFAKSLDNVASSDFPNATDSLFSQLFGRQLYGLGNPAAFALQSSSAGYGSNGGVRGAELSQGENPSAPVSSSNPNISASQLLQAVNVPTFNAIQSALTTTGNRLVNTSHYSLPQNPLAFSSSGVAAGTDYGRSDDDVGHRIVADFVYRPTLGWRWVHNITISGITIIQTGQPFTIFSGPAYNQITQQINLPSRSAIRTSVNPAGYFSGVTAANLSTFLPSLNNTSCPALYATPTLYQQGSNENACLGNGGRNTYTGPTYFAQDLAAQKGFVTHEGQLLIFRAEFYNISNRANYYNPISEISPDGVHLNPEFGLIRSAHDPRQIQFAARYDF